MKKPHPFRTRRAAWSLIIAAALLALLALLPCLRAGTVVDPPGSLRFNFEIHPGKDDWIQGHLTAKGFFMVHSEGTSRSGNLTAAETLRIFAEFEKLCAATGAENIPPVRGIVGRVVPPYFHYESPQGRILALNGRENPPPPALAAFMITLSQKLLDQASKNPPATSASSLILLPPQNPPALR